LKGPYSADNENNIQQTIKMKRKFWTIAYWILLVCWITGALLFMARVRAGFMTNYLSDLTFPAWFYIYIRGLSNTYNRRPKLLIFKEWFGLSPQRALISIFAVGAISEVKTFYWPTGIISGTFDYFDIIAYAIGLLICFYFDSRKSNVTFAIKI